MRRELLVLTCLLTLLCASCAGLPFEEEDPYAARGVNAFPLYRSQTDPVEGISRTDVLWPLGFQRHVDRRSGEAVTHVLYPFFAKWKRPGGTTIYILELGHFLYGSLLNIEWQQPSGFGVHVLDLFGHPLLRWYRARTESDYWLFPFFGHHSERVAGQRGYDGWALWPLIGWHRGPDERSLKALPFYYRRASQSARKSIVFAVLFFRLNSPERTFWTLFPLVWKTREDDQYGHRKRLSVVPFYFHRHEKNEEMDRTRILVPPFYSYTVDRTQGAKAHWSPAHYYAVRSGPGTFKKVLSILWLYWSRTDTAGSSTKLIPFFFKAKDTEGRHVVIPPFYMDFESYTTGKRTLIAWPYIHRRTARTAPDARESTSIAWPAYTATTWDDGSVGRQVLGLLRYKSSPTGRERSWWAGPVYYDRDGNDVAHGLLGIYGRRRAGNYRGLNILWGQPPYRPGDRSHFGILWRLFEKRTYAGGSRLSILYDLVVSKRSPGETFLAVRPFFSKRTSYTDRAFSILGIYRQSRSRHRTRRSLFGIDWTD